MTTTTTPTAGARASADITALLRARNTLLWVTTREELRVERALVEAAAAARYEALTWDCAAGICQPDGRVIANTPDPSAALAWLRDQRGRRVVLVMRDLHKWQDPIILRMVKNVARTLQAAPTADARAIVVLSPSSEIPLEWQGQVQALDYPLPDRAEVAQLLADVVSTLPEELRAVALPAEVRDAAIDAAVGLSAEEASSCYARSLVTSRKIDPALVGGEKRRVIARERVLTWYEPDPRGLAAIGGLDVLKGWLTARRAAFSQRARAFGLPSPKGVMLVGVPGGGKSLTAKAVAAAWQMPLLRLDMGALRSKFVGDSEANIRKALAVAEAVSPCVLWLDEIEKALAGASGPAGDGGVAADALGAVLSWMQDRAGAVFVIATANDVRALPPELLRKGRFDELFFVDLPTQRERAAIVRASLAGRGADVDAAAVAAVTEGWTGAEIAALVPDALYTAFADGERDLTTADLTTAAASVVPLSKTAADKIKNLRDWAAGNARRASLPEDTTGSTGRQLDL